MHLNASISFGILNNDSVSLIVIYDTFQYNFVNKHLTVYHSCTNLVLCAYGFINTQLGIHFWVNQPNFGKCCRANCVTRWI